MRLRQNSGEHRIDNANVVCYTCGKPLMPETSYGVERRPAGCGGKPISLVRFCLEHSVEKPREVDEVRKLAEFLKNGW